MGISTKVETPPNILHDGHRNPYQSEKAIKSGETVFFCLYPYQGDVSSKELDKKVLTNIWRLPCNRFKGLLHECTIQPLDLRQRGLNSPLCLR